MSEKISLDSSVFIAYYPHPKSCIYKLNSRFNYVRPFTIIGFLSQISAGLFF